MFMVVWAPFAAVRSCVTSSITDGRQQLPGRQDVEICFSPEFSVKCSHPLTVKGLGFPLDSSHS
jgi:hypothetical protein